MVTYAETALRSSTVTADANATCAFLRDAINDERGLLLSSRPSVSSLGMRLASLAPAMSPDDLSSYRVGGFRATGQPGSGGQWEYSKHLIARPYPPLIFRTR